MITNSKQQFITYNSNNSEEDAEFIFAVITYMKIYIVQVIFIKNYELKKDWVFELHQEFHSII